MKNVFKGLAIVLFAITLTCSGFGQQTIFNVPSADITPKGMTYLETEGQFRASGPGSYYYSSNFFARGLGGNTELDTSLYGLSSPRSGNVTMGVGFKTAFPLFAKRYAAEAFQLTVGEQVLLSAQGEGAGYWAYAHLSGKVPHTGTRLTAGLSRGTKQLFGVDTTVVIAGFEQPLTPQLNIISDWYSGANSLGFSTTGFSWTFSKVGTFYLGYQIPNNSSAAGRSGITSELSFQF